MTVERYDVQVNFSRPSGAGVETYWQTVNSPGTYVAADKLAYYASTLNAICTRVQVVNLSTGNARTTHEYGTQHPPMDVRAWARECPGELLPRPQSPQGWAPAEELAVREVLGR